MEVALLYAFAAAYLVGVLIDTRQRAVASAYAAVHTGWQIHVLAQHVTAIIVLRYALKTSDGVVQSTCNTACALWIAASFVLRGCSVSWPSLSIILLEGVTAFRVKLLPPGLRLLLALQAFSTAGASI